MYITLLFLGHSIVQRRRSRAEEEEEEEEEGAEARRGCVGDGRVSKVSGFLEFLDVDVDALHWLISGLVSDGS